MGMTHPIWTPLTCPFQICMGLMGMKRDRQKWGLLLMLRLPVLLKMSQMFHCLMAKIVGLSKAEDVSCELKPNRIRRNAIDLKNLISLIEQTMNHFSSQLDKSSLFNIGSGKAAAEETKIFLP